MKIEKSQKCYLLKENEKLWKRWENTDLLMFFDTGNAYLEIDKLYKTIIQISKSGNCFLLHMNNKRILGMCICMDQDSPVVIYYHHKYKDPRYLMNRELVKRYHSHMINVDFMSDPEFDDSCVVISRNIQ